MQPRTRLSSVVAVLAAVAGARSTSVDTAAAPVQAAEPKRVADGRATQALAEITIPHADDLRGSVTLPTAAAVPARS